MKDKALSFFCYKIFRSHRSR